VLDHETLQLIQRAQPLPELPQDLIELVVPLRFELR
jgi:outer membrane biosynthesis protein TonB